MSENNSKLNIAELIITKLCHDLAGPIGGINNGVEMLNEDDESLKDTALELLNMSSGEALSRLQFFRFAYGTVDTESSVSIENIKLLVNNFFNIAKSKPVWEISEGVENFTKKHAKLLVNSILTVSTFMLKGGEIIIKIKSVGFSISGKSEKIKVDERIKSIFDNTFNSELDEKAIQPYLTKTLLDNFSNGYSFENSENFVTLLINY